MVYKRHRFHFPKFSIGSQLAVEIEWTPLSGNPDTPEVSGFEEWFTRFPPHRAVEEHFGPLHFEPFSRR